MRILLLNSIAEERSTGQIMYELYSFLKCKGVDVRFYYGRGQKPEENNNINIIELESEAKVRVHGVLSRITGLQGYFSNHATNKLLKEIEVFNPDAVILGNIHGYYINAFKLLKYLKEHTIRTYYYMFDEYAFLGKCTYFNTCDRFKTQCCDCPKKKTYPSSLLFDTSKRIFNDKMQIYTGFNELSFIGVPYTVSRSKEAALFINSKAKVYDYGWGIDTHAALVPMDSDKLRKELKIPDGNLIVLAVAPLSIKRKGIKQYYYPLAKMLKDKPISFIHVGFDGTENDRPDNIITSPFLKDQKLLATYFSLADLLVMTSSNEGYPTVCLDSLSCGTPICGFDISGTPYVAREPYGRFVKAFDLEALAEVVLDTKPKDKSVIDSCREYATNYLDSGVIFARVLDQIEADTTIRRD